MVIPPSLLELEGWTPSSLEDMEGDDHLQDDGPSHGHLGPAFLVFFASHRLKEDLGIGGNQGCC